jgi:hypothetical protein
MSRNALSSIITFNILFKIFLLFTQYFQIFQEYILKKYKRKRKQMMFLILQLFEKVEKEFFSSTAKTWDFKDSEDSVGA